MSFSFEKTVAQAIYRTGSTQPVETAHQPGLLLAGGATDNNDAMRWMLERADGGDVVVLRAGGSDGYNNYLYSALGVEVNSVTSIVIQSTEHANSDQVLDIVKHAEVVFIAGGNQWNYVDHWRGTRLQATLNELANRKKITIGGTSAGMAVLGQVVFSAENNTVWSSEALSDPYHWRMMLERDFLDIPLMEYTVTDTHYNRIQGDDMGRKGRHVGFLARMVADWDMPARGIAANEYTAVAVDGQGRARVFGDPAYDDYAYFLQAYGGPPETAESGKPLHWDRDARGLMVYRVKGDRQGSRWFDLADWINGHGGHWHHWFVRDGVLHESPPLDDEPWIRIEVWDAEEQRPVEGAEVSLIHHGNKTTPHYGLVNFRPLESGRAWDFVVMRQGYIPLEGSADLQDDNVALRVELVPGDATAANLPGAEPLFSVYPNPASGFIHIQSGKEIKEVCLISLTGQVIYREPVAGKQHTVQPGHLPEGLYLLQVVTAAGSTVQRVQLLR